MILPSYIEHIKEFAFGNKKKFFEKKKNKKNEKLNEFSFYDANKIKNYVKINQNSNEKNLNSDFIENGLKINKKVPSEINKFDIDKINKYHNSIKHECKDYKVIKTKINNFQIKTEQKCIHQLHPECLNLSNTDEGCLVCNALLIGSNRKTSTFKINSEEDKNLKILIHELKILSKVGWYWGPINRYEAEDKLFNKPNGTFLIRDSFDTNFILSLSFKIQEGVFHSRIEYSKGLFYFYLHPNKAYKSISNLVDDLILNSKTGIFYYVKSKKTGKEVRFIIKLDKPLSRYSEIKSLKYLCRFTIKKDFRYDLIKHLPIPNTIKDYLKENHY